MGGSTARRSIRSRANWTESWSFGPSVNTKSYAPTSGKLGTGSRASRVVVQSCLLTGSWHVAWLHDGSRMTRECPVRFCERLGVKLPEATLPGEALIGITFVSGNSLTLLNLQLGVRRELLLAIDSSLAGSLELIRFANFVEQG